MKTSSWNAPSNSATSASSNDLTAAWLLTPLIFTSSVLEEPHRYEVMSACYRCWQFSQMKTPFRLALENGVILAAWDNGELILDESFRVCFEVFKEVMATEKLRSITETLKELESQISQRESSSARSSTPL